MKLIHVDVETRSKASLSSSTKRVGSWAYSQDSSTDVWCVCYAEEGQEVQVWVPGDPVPDCLSEPYILAAHNYAFEEAIFTNILVPRYGFYPPPAYRCTMAQAMRHNLPASLDDLSQRLGLTETKDKEGSKLMVKMANATRYDPDKEGSTAAKNHTEDLARLIAYCKQDVLTEIEVAKYFTASAMSKDEFELDREINERGIRVDVKTAKAISKAIKDIEKQLNAELKGITAGEVGTAREHAKFLKWIKKHGYPHDNIQAATVRDTLKDPDGLDMQALAALEIRQKLALGSLAKFDVMTRNADEDDRLHGLFQLYGASQTGRWAGRMVQIQNLPRMDLKDSQVEELVELFRKGNIEAIIAKYGADIFATAKQMIRPMFMAKEGCELIVSDLAQIEARVLAWLSGCQSLIDQFTDEHLDPYSEMAAKIFDKPSYKCGKGTSERQVGKAAVLGCGFGLGAKGFAENVWNMERIRLSEDEARHIVETYRSSFPEIVTTWYALETASYDILHERKTAVEIQGKLIVASHPGAMKIYLPSGRSLYYHGLRNVTSEDGKTICKFQSATGNWLRVWLGQYIENVVQAIARDVLMDRMNALDLAGFDTIAHVHDEVILEVPESPGLDDLKHVQHIMSTIPEWATGLPLDAETAKAKRYTK